MQLTHDTHALACQHTVTGWKDPALTEQGRGEALKGAQELKKYGYVSRRRG